ncbi:hypothetical protein N7510_001343 [Penicillium lagena]|uniref:uncharacterized protein n=1 Tax=Penicillium lagena TaxID=94218 RepID=UPI002541837C|nr:uncharacterized protein N7510_001343 [Penicillium lagena]KAJ5625034.1 hypothetical protein N7510_001343 [Penicillium lagena]
MLPELQSMGISQEAYIGRDQKNPVAVTVGPIVPIPTQTTYNSVLARINPLVIGVGNSSSPTSAEMASTLPPAASPKANMSPTTITLHILCPSLAPHNRITMLNFALSTTIAQLKDKLAADIATHPAPSTQRLIYGGKRLEQDDVTLEAVLAPIDVRFLVFCSCIQVTEFFPG